MQVKKNSACMYSFLIDEDVWNWIQNRHLDPIRIFFPHCNMFCESFRSKFHEIHEIYHIVDQDVDLSKTVTFV